MKNRKQVLVVGVNCAVLNCKNKEMNSCLTCKRFDLSGVEVMEILEDHRDHSELPPKDE